MKTTFTFIRLAGMACMACWLSTAALAQSTLAEIKDIAPEETKFAGFVLDSEQEISIEAVGTHHRTRHFMTSAAWILNADNRELAWELTDANSRWLDRRLREYNDSVKLPAGRYEVYYSNFPQWHDYDGWSFTKFFFGKDHDEMRYDDELMSEFRITVTGAGKAVTTQEVIDYQERLKERAVVRLTTDRDEQYLKQGFKLQKPMDLIVYCLGEARDGTFDYGWIINTDTRQQVWRFDDRESEFAGGAEKNRYMRETISLPAGTYAAFYVTDDSHSPREWNAAPPYDPAFWGFTIYAKDEGSRSSIRLFDYENTPPKNVFVELTGIRESEYVSKGFTLKKDMKVRIYALGEGTRGEMYDYGWITDASTRDRVWEMDNRNTEPAGGNEKNRMSDDIINLKKGSYIVHYISDDSHSFGEWNASPPFDQEKWGITLMGVDAGFKAGDVSEYKPSEDPNVLTRIVQVRDWDNVKKPFSLKKDSKIRIYAIGEGRSGEMFDYAWIEDAGGKVVWEMTYRKTEHAGGNRKNRIFNDVIMLRAGDYTLHYETDDSHSFSDWNASPPDDPVSYGVTLYKTDQ